MEGSASSRFWCTSPRLRLRPWLRPWLKPWLKLRGANCNGAAEAVRMKRKGASDFFYSGSIMITMCEKGLL